MDTSVFIQHPHEEQQQHPHEQQNQQAQEQEQEQEQENTPRDWCPYRILQERYGLKLVLGVTGLLAGATAVWWWRRK